MQPDTFRHQGLREQLVAELRRKNIASEDVLNAIGRVPRHVFFDSIFSEIAYSDKAFPIGSGQTISMPSTVAQQTEFLKVTKGMKVLEIGTGSGYQACVLAELGASVYTIERQRNLYFKTKPLLAELYPRIKCFLADGFNGLPTYAPFDRVIITAGAKEIPIHLVEQLKIGGIMIIPFTQGKEEIMYRLTKQNDGSLLRENLGSFHFVPMLKNLGND